MMKPIFMILLGLCWCAHPTVAQLYTNANANLPNNGAKGASMDVRAADLDADGDLDIVLANEFQPNTILLNNGSGVFTNGTSGNLPQPGRDSEDVAIADFDNDGDLDLVFCSEDDVTLGFTNVHEFYLNNGTGDFTAAAFQLPDSEANTVISADINNDSLPDLLFGNNGFNSVLINNGDGSFTAENDRIPPVNRTTQDLALADVDGDDDLDLFEGNENGNLLHLNDGTGHFSDVTATHLPQGLNIETRKVTFGDIDTDGDLDVFLSNVEFIDGKDRQNRLFVNDGTGHFSDATGDILSADNDYTLDAIFEDVDLDSDLDIVVANSFGAPIKIYGNNGAGVFADSTQIFLGANYYRDALGVIAADFNGDGFRDLYVCDRFRPETNRKDLLLLRNPVVSSSTVQQGATADITIFPNPVDTHFFIQTNLKSLDSVQLESPDGRVVQNLAVQNVGNGLFRCKLGGTQLTQGVYHVKIGAVRKSVMLR
jgi:FG-GAP-like repeat